MNEFFSSWRTRLTRFPKYFQLGEVRLARFKSFLSELRTPADFWTHRWIIKADIPLLQGNTGRQFAECSAICGISRTLGDKTG
jgi:hypothetical protein